MKPFATILMSAWLTTLVIIFGVCAILDENGR
jgi:hypothetical protein